MNYLPLEQVILGFILVIKKIVVAVLDGREFQRGRYRFIEISTRWHDEYSRSYRGKYYQQMGFRGYCERQYTDD